MTSARKNKQRGSVFMMASAAFAAIVFTVAIVMFAKSRNQLALSGTGIERLQGDLSSSGLVGMIVREIGTNMSNPTSLQTHHFGDWERTELDADGFKAVKVFSGYGAQVVAEFKCPNGCDGSVQNSRRSLHAELSLFQPQSGRKRYALLIRGAILSDMPYVPGGIPGQLIPNSLGVWSENDLVIPKPLCENGDSVLTNLKTTATKIDFCASQAPSLLVPSLVSQKSVYDKATSVELARREANALSTRSKYDYYYNLWKQWLSDHDASPDQDVANPFDGTLLSANAEVTTTTNALAAAQDEYDKYFSMWQDCDQDKNCASKNPYTDQKDTAYAALLAAQSAKATADVAAAKALSDSNEWQTANVNPYAEAKDQAEAAWQSAQADYDNYLTKLSSMSIATKELTVANLSSLTCDKTPVDWKIRESIDTKIEELEGKAEAIDFVKIVGNDCSINVQQSNLIWACGGQTHTVAMGSGGVTILAEPSDHIIDVQVSTLVPVSIFTPTDINIVGDIKVVKEEGQWCGGGITSNCTSLDQKPIIQVAGRDILVATDRIPSPLNANMTLDDVTTAIPATTPVLKVEADIAATGSALFTPAVSDGAASPAQTSLGAIQIVGTIATATEEATIATPLVASDASSCTQIGPTPILTPQSTGKLACGARAGYGCPREPIGSASGARTVVILNVVDGDGDFLAAQNRYQNP